MTSINYPAMAVYTTLNYLPFVPPLFYSFRPFYRFSRKTLDALIALSVILRIGLQYLYTKGLPIYLVYLLTCVMLIALFSTMVDGHFWRLLMTMFITLNISMLASVLAQYSEQLFFPGVTLNTYHWYSVLFLSFWELPILIVFQYFIVNYYGPTIMIQNKGEIWKFIWIVPGTFYLLWNAYIYSMGGMVQPDLSRYTLVTFMVLLLNGGSFIMYYVILRLLRLEYAGHWHRQIRTELSNINNQDPETKLGSHKYGEKLIGEYIIKRSKAFIILMQNYGMNDQTELDTIVKCITENLQPDDVAIRWEQDKFLILLESSTEGTIQADAEYILRSLGTISCCMGISQIRESEVSSKNLRERLKTALEEASYQGTGHYCIKL